MLRLCSGGQNIRTEATLCWVGLGEGPAQEEGYPEGCISAVGYWKPRWSDYVHTSSRLLNLVYLNVKKKNTTKQIKNVLSSLLCVYCISS